MMAGQKSSSRRIEVLLDDREKIDQRPSLLVCVLGLVTTEYSSAVSMLEELDLSSVASLLRPSSPTSLK